MHEIFDISDRVYIIAGGAGQIGFEFARTIANCGGKAIIADNDPELAQDKLKSCNESIQENIEIIKTDFTIEEEISYAYEQAFNRYGIIHGLINCFHYKGNSRRLQTDSPFFKDLENYPIEAWDMVHNVNLKGTFLASQKIIPFFKKNSFGGVIINISSTYGMLSANESIYGDSGINSPVAYATSKAGILNLSRYFATHLAKYKIRVNTLVPGGILNNQSEEFIANYTNLTPLKRMANADEYSGAIIFLLSDASSYMTGSTLVIDGGWTAW
jgi:NAD(P)-dependent dehydrogenase (short-subunit alcohol dehydrogenase family)